MVVQLTRKTLKNIFFLFTNKFAMNKKPSTKKKRQKDYFFQMFVSIRVYHYCKAVWKPAYRKTYNSDTQCSNQGQFSLQQPDGVILDTLFNRPLSHYCQNFFRSLFYKPVIILIYILLILQSSCINIKNKKLNNLD